MATSIPVTAHRSDEDALIAVDSPGIGIRIEGPAEPEEMSLHGHSVDGSHAWCAKVLKSPLQLQVEGGNNPVNWNLPLRSRSPDFGTAPLSSPSLSPPPSPSASSPGSNFSGYDFAPYTPPDDDRRELDDSTGGYVILQELQDHLTRRGELLPLLQESPNLLSFSESPVEQEILRSAFSEEEVALLNYSIVDSNSPSADCLFPNSTSPSIPLSGYLTGSPVFPLGLHSPQPSENGGSNTVLTTEIPPLGRKPLEHLPPLPPSPEPLLLKPDSAPNSTCHPSMDDKRVVDRSLSAHRHNSMSTLSSIQGPHGVHGSAVTHYHSPETRPHSPSVVRRSLARHARIRSRSASPYEASSELHAHPRRSSSRSISDFHAPIETQPFLTQSHRTSPRDGVIARPGQPASSYRLRAASFDSPTSKKTAPPTSNVRASYKPDDGSGEDVEMGSTLYAPIVQVPRKRSFSLSSSSTSSSNSIASPPPRSSTGHHADTPIARGSRSFHDRNPMAVDPKDDEAGPSTDEGESGSEADDDYRNSRPSSFTSYSPASHHFHSSRASSSPYSRHHPRSHSVSPSRPTGHGDTRHTYRITAVAPSDVSPSHAPLEASRKARRVSHSPVRHPEAVPSKTEEFDESPYYKRSSPTPFSPRRVSYHDFESDDEDDSVIDEEEEDEDYRGSPGAYTGSRRSPVKRTPLPRRGSNAHLATKPIYGSPLKGSILPTDPPSDAEPSPAAKPRTISSRGRPRSGSGTLPYPPTRPSAANTSSAGLDVPSTIHYRNVGSKNIDMASEKRRKGEKRFQCCYKDCKKMFTTNQNRQIHQWKHTGEKPYKCKCGYGSASRSDLQRHLRRKKTVNPLCDEIPVDKVYLNALVTELAAAEDDE